MTKRKKSLREDLDKLLDFYGSQVDFVGGREVPVFFSPKELDRFAKRREPFEGAWTYRGFTLRRSVGAKA